MIEFIVSHLFSFIIGVIIGSIGGFLVVVTCYLYLNVYRMLNKNFNDDFEIGIDDE